MSRIGREEQRRQAQNGKTTFYRGPVLDEDEDEVLPRDIEEGR